MGPEHLLPGETRTSQLVDDAEHWIRVYSEFIRFKSELLAEIDAASQKLAEDLRATASITDVAQLRTQYERLLERLEFWKNRLVELKAAGS
jgi:ubiquinone biosynthesis protein UbiJ